MVEYATDIYILKPIDPSKGNHKLIMDIPNRGAKKWGDINNSRGGDDPTTAAQAGEAFLMNRGYTIGWCAWDISAPQKNDLLTIQVPIARNPDGSSITGPSYEYISSDNEQSSYELTYPTASLDKTKATLTVREHLNDPAQNLPATAWEFCQAKRPSASCPLAHPFARARSTSSATPRERSAGSRPRSSLQPVTSSPSCATKEDENESARRRHKVHLQLHRISTRPAISTTTRPSASTRTSKAARSSTASRTG